MYHTSRHQQELVKFSVSKFPARPPNTYTRLIINISQIILEGMFGWPGAADFLQELRFNFTLFCTYMSRLSGFR